MRAATIRYRVPAIEGTPSPGAILMGDGPRVRRAYRILSAISTKSRPIGLGVVTWKLKVEPMSASTGRQEIEAGTPHWSIKWDSRKRAPR